MFVEDCSCATVSIKVSGNGDSIGVPVVESSSCINIYICADKYEPSGYLNIHSRYKKDMNCVRFLINLIDWQRSN